MSTHPPQNISGTKTSTGIGAHANKLGQPSDTTNPAKADPSYSTVSGIDLRGWNWNDAPVLNDASVTVGAGAANGTLLATLAATDIDGPALSYAITAGNTGGAFVIQPATGALTVANSAAVTGTTFTLTVTVSDGTLTDTATITVTVTAAPADLLFSNGFE